MSGTVIAGYDGSDCARAAVRTAVQVSRAYGDRLVVAFAYDPSPVGGELQDYQAALDELAQQRIEEASALAATDGVPVEGVIVKRAPAHGLVALARERDARVIVVGTQGEGLIRGALLGSVAYKLLGLTDRPVLVVPAGPG